MQNFKRDQKLKRNSKDSRNTITERQNKAYVGKCLPKETSLSSWMHQVAFTYSLHHFWEKCAREKLLYSEAVCLYHLHSSWLSTHFGSE